MNILVLNTGSSSLKLSLFQMENDLPKIATAAQWQLKLDVKWQSGDAESWRALLSEKVSLLWTGKEKLLSGPDKIDIVGHRVVHGGPKYLKSALIDRDVKSDIEQFAKLAPLHNEINLDGIIAMEEALPKTTKQVAVFDTAFHRSIPLYASLYPVPYDWYENWAVHKFGFHGINYQYCSERAAQLLNRSASGLNLIVCHLGSGCSVAAIKDGKSVDTTMGFTPLDGMMMSTRSGGIDPGILIYLLRNTGMSVDDVESALNHSSGLLGISQESGDLKKIIDELETGSKRARLAFDMYAFSLRRAICQMHASLSKLDAIIFTAGVGEHAIKLRETVCQDLSFLGVKLDSALNQKNLLDSKISSDDSTAQIFLIEAREDWQIARECWAIVG